MIKKDNNIMYTLGRQKIIECLLESDKTTRQISERLDKNWEYAKKSLNKLEEMGIIKSKRIKGQKFIYYYINDKKRALKFTKIKDIKELYEANLTIESIRRYIGVSNLIVKNYLKNCGIDIINNPHVNISVEDYLKLKILKDRPLNVIQKEIKHGQNVIERWLKHFNWFNYNLHSGKKRFFEIKNVDELVDIVEQKFFKNFSVTGSIYRLKGYYCDFLYEYNNKNILVEIKKTLDRNSFSRAVLQLLMGQFIIEKIFNKNISEKWIVYDSLSSSKNKIYSKNQFKEIVEHFNIKIIDVNK